MALFDRFRVSGEELERDLGRPLRGDPSQGGRGVLVANAQDSTGYERVDARAQLQKLKVNSFPTRAAHALAVVDAGGQETR